MQRKIITSLILILLLAMMIFVTFSGCKESDPMLVCQELSFCENFKIMQLSDIQVTTVAECDDAFVLLDKMIEQQKPNLIVLTGDNIQYPNDTRVVQSLIDHMDFHKIPWAPVFGNHDDEYGYVTKEEYSQLFEQSEYCMYQRGPTEIQGYGNYVINLMDNKKAVYTLFFMDSNNYDKSGDDYYHQDQWPGPYDYIYPNQIEWYVKNVRYQKELNDGVVVPSLAFFHIPLMEYLDAKLAWQQDNSLGQAIIKDTFGSSYKNNGFFYTMLNEQSTIGVFVGHEHMNCFDINYKGIRLNYGLKSSRYSYYDESMLGVKNIILTRTGFVTELVYFSQLN